MKPVGHQRFWRLFGVSVLLHAAIFAAMQSPWAKTSRPLPPIIASFKPSVSASEAGASQRVANPRVANPHRESPREVAAEPKAVAQRKIPPENRQAAAKPVVQAEKGSEMKIAAASAGPASAAPAMPPMSSVEPVPAPVAAAAAMAAPSPRAQSDALASYRQRLSELFAGKQAYPRLAAMRGWEGEVRLRLKVARKGNLVSIALDHSSGFEVLDQNALAMVEAIAALPALPDTLEASEIQIVVPISYKLRKTT